MTKKKLIALMLCIAMVCSMTVYAVGEDATCTCGTTTEVHAAECALNIVPEGASVDEPVCTCETETEIHADTCPLYVAPAPECTCATENDVHADTCPLYVAPIDDEPIVEEEPIDEEIVEEEIVVELSFFETVLAAESVEDMYIAFCADQDAAAALTAEQIDALISRVDVLDPEGDDADTEALVDLLINLPNFISGAEEDGEEGETFVAKPDGAPADAIKISETIHELTDGGYYYLEKATYYKEADAKPFGTGNYCDIYIPKGATVTLDLNGQALFGSGKGCIIYNLGHLTIVDSRPNWTTRRFITKTDGPWEFVASTASSEKLALVDYTCSGGIITGGREQTPANESADGGGAIRMKAASTDMTLTINGGTIVGNHTTRAGGGTYGGAVTMNGGKIIGNYADRMAGGASVSGSFEMNGGYIGRNETGPSSQHNQPENDTIFYDNANIIIGYSSNFVMTAGQIDGTISTVFRESITNPPTATISGGTINGNFRILNQNTATISGGTMNGYIYMLKGDCTVKGSALIQNGKRENGAGVCLMNGSFKMEGGTIQNAEASSNGGAIYVGNGSAEVSGGTIKNCNAAANGGAIYVAGGGFNMSGGEIQNNHASIDGGAVYVTGGNFTLSNGTISDNSTNQNGGAAYVNGGNFTMSGGTLGGSSATAGNRAINGGAVYVNAGDFIMISGYLLNNGSTDSKTTEYGGAVYVNGGNIQVGVENCAGGDKESTHTSTHTDKIHPVIMYNKALYGGAFAIRGENNSQTGAAITGKVTVYCSYILDNKADNEGTGHNIFMDGGGITHYLNSATIGQSNNHEIVTIGGQLQVVMDGEIIEIKLIYDSNAQSITTQWEGQAPLGYHINLPYCPKDWQESQAANNKAFVGWTNVKKDTTLASSVRDKDDYNPIGKAIEIEDSDGDGKMVFYAVWAPLVNNIKYAYTLNGVDVIQVTDAAALGIPVAGDDDHSNYTYQNISYQRNIPDPVRAGYAFAGWLIYADTSKISNWDADPIPVGFASSNVKLLENIQQPVDPIWNGTIDRNFGDIILVAVFEPVFTNLTIKKDVGLVNPDPDQSYIFHIVGTSDSGTPVDMRVVLTGNTETTIQEIPVGEYTITEESAWSWRYNVNEVTVTNADKISKVDDGVKVDISDPAKTSKVEFKNSRENIYWLDFNAIAENVFNAKA